MGVIFWLSNGEVLVYKYQFLKNNLLFDRKPLKGLK